MVMEVNAYEKRHALLIPMPTQGHIIPLFRLAQRLAKNGIAVTFACFEKGISSLRAKYSEEELQALDIRLLGCGGEPTPIDNVGVYMNHILTGLQKGLQPLLEKLVADRMSGIAIPCCIISDFFLYWTQDFASQLGIPRYEFMPSGAILARVFQLAPELYEQGTLALGDKNQVIPYDGVIQLPGVVSLGYSEWPSSFKMVPDDVKRLSRAQAAARGVVVNTFYELEPTPIDTYLRSSQLENAGDENHVSKIFPIGPAVTAATFTDFSVVQSMDRTGNECMKWLETRPESSVLFICFGSIFQLNPPQITQLALALEASPNLGFLWALPRGRGNFENLEDVLPKDFLKKVGGRGLVTTGWVPQVQVLAHPSIGGFLSHCGWSSTTESVTSGVPIIAWPHGAEQFLNCRYLVDVLKVAKELHRRADGVVEQKEFESAFKYLLEEQGKGMRKRIQTLKSQASVSVAPGGSSHSAFLRLVADINSLPV